MLVSARAFLYVPSQWLCAFLLYAEASLLSGSQAYSTVAIPRFGFLASPSPVTLTLFARFPLYNFTPQAAAQ